MFLAKLAPHFALLCLLFSAFSPLVAPLASAAELLEISVYHAEEVSAKAGQGKPWLGLFPTKAGQFELKQAKVLVTLVNDPIADESPDKKTGRKITVSGLGEPIVLLRGISGLKAGRVPGSDLKKERMSIGETVKLKVGTKTASLIVSGKKKDEEILTNYTVVLESGGAKQELFKRPEVGIGGLPSLLWSGDLDGDGKIDLLMDMTDHYNLRKVTLFLSGKAKPGKLVQQVAFIEATGC